MPNQIIQVDVKPNSKDLKLIKISDNIYKAFLTTIPEKGKANKQLIELLSEELKTAKSNIRIMAGMKARKKLVEIIRS